MGALKVKLSEEELKQIRDVVSSAGEYRVETCTSDRGSAR